MCERTLTVKKPLYAPDEAADLESDYDLNHLCVLARVPGQVKVCAHIMRVALAV